MSHGAVTRHGPLDKNIGLEFTICFSCVLTMKMSFGRENTRISLPSHSDVGTLLKAKDSSFLSFFSGFQPPNIAVHRAVVYVGIVILAVKTEKKATCWRERRKQDFNSCPASVLLRSTTAVYEVAFQGRIDSRERHGHDRQCSSKRVHGMKARLYIDSNFDKHIFTYLLNRLPELMYFI